MERLEMLITYCRSLRLLVVTGTLAVLVDRPLSSAPPYENTEISHFAIKNSPQGDAFHMAAKALEQSFYKSTQLQKLKRQQPTWYCWKL